MITDLKEINMSRITVPHKTKTTKLRFWFKYIIIGPMVMVILLMFYFNNDRFWAWVKNHGDDTWVIGIIAAVVIGVARKIKKEGKLAQENIRRLGIPFKHKLTGPFLADWKGQKVQYELRQTEYYRFAQLSLSHRRPLHIGLCLTKQSSKKIANLLSIHKWLLIALGSKQIEVPPDLRERGFKCWVKDKTVGTLLIASDKVVTPLIHLDETIKHYQGALMVDDHVVRIVFPYDTLFDNSILESAYPLSTSLSTSIMLPPIFHDYIRFENKVLNVLLITLITTIIFLIGWLIMQSLGK